MQSKHKKRICIVCRSLAEGGADRVAAMQSVFLSNLGYKVFIVTVLNSMAYPYKGELLNLGKLKAQNNTIIGRFKRLLVFKRFLKTNKIDVVIDHRVRTKPFSEYIISALIYPKDTVYVVHNYAIDLYFPPFKCLTKLLYKSARSIVSVSNGIEQQIKNTYGFKNLKTIYNPIDFEYIISLKDNPISISEPFIFWYGRFDDEQKNISLLIEAYQCSKLAQKNIKLVLMGNGKDKGKILDKISKLSLESNIQIIPFSENPFAYINASKFTLLSSRFEGFPMTILESLACGVPVVSVTYKNYEDGVIVNEYNGLLVDNYNSKQLAKAFNRFITDETLYSSCKANAKQSVANFDVNSIAQQWEQLLNK